MKTKARYRAFVRSWLLPTATLALTIGIFVADIATDLEISVASLYVLVVLLATLFAEQGVVLRTAAGCMLLTVLGSFITLNGGSQEAGVINGATSLMLIASATYLALKGKSAEAAKLEAQAQLAHVARLTTLGEMTASIAHEVRQPLAAVVTNGNACSRWLAVQPPNLEEVRQAIERIVQEANRANEVIGRVRQLATRGRLQNARLNVNEIVLEVVDLARGDIRRNRIEVRTELSEDLPLVLGDRIQLQQVFLNLIINAIDAMSTVENGPRELVVSSSMDQSSSLRLTVSDSGHGLPPGKQDLIFEPFHTTKPGGMGMGLAISRSIVEAHGGRIWAAPGAHRGATFCLTLPARGDEPA